MSTTDADLPAMADAYAAAHADFAATGHTTAKAYADLARSNLMDAIAALSAQPAPGMAVPDGWQLVPIEPTREMLDAYVNLNSKFHSARSDWAAMLAAAPTPSQGKGEHG